MKNKKKFVILILIGILIITCLAAFDIRLKIQHYTLHSDKVTQHVRISLITDLHSCAYGDDELTLIEAIKEQNPDIVLLGGDICDDILPHDNTEALLKGIAYLYPCYYVTGNHEYWSGDIDTILNLFETYDVKILNGDFETIEINGQKLNICGISDPDITRYTDSETGWRQQLDMLLDVHENGAYTILLAHRPENIDSYLEGNFDLILSGHAHGGQWRLPGLINGVFAPNQGLFPKYAGGEYTFDQTTMIVSRGLAKETTSIPRIFNRPELVIVDLEP